MADARTPGSRQAAGGSVFSGGRFLPGARGVKLEYFRRDVKVTNLARGYVEPPKNSTRDEMAGFTWESRRRLIFVGNNTDMQFHSLLTLTYPETFPHCGPCSAEHLRMLLQAAQREVGLTAYLWVREFQERNAAHWHILTDVRHTGRMQRFSGCNPATDAAYSYGSRRLQRWVSDRWQEIIKEYGTEAGRRAGCRWEVLRSDRGAAGYLAAYASKHQQKRVPDEFCKPGRWWGHSRNVAVGSPAAETVVSLPDYIEGTEGPVQSPAGWLYGTLMNGAERAKRFRPAEGEEKADAPLIHTRRLRRKKPETDAGTEEGGKQ